MWKGRTGIVLICEAQHPAFSWFWQWKAKSIAQTEGLTRTLVVNSLGICIVLVTGVVWAKQAPMKRVHTILVRLFNVILIVIHPPSLDFPGSQSCYPACCESSMRMTSTKRWLTLFSGVSYCENPVIGSCWDTGQGEFLHLFTALKFLHSIPHWLLSFIEELEFLPFQCRCHRATKL